MHRVQKPLASSSFLSRASSFSHPLLSSQQYKSTSFINHTLSSFSFIHRSVTSSRYTWFSLIAQSPPFHAFCCPSSSTSHISTCFSPCTCSYSYNVHWCHLPASNETQHIKISISLARTFRACWIIDIHISALHSLTPREVLLFSTPSNEIWMAPFFILTGMIVLPRWV